MKNQTAATIGCVIMIILGLILSYDSIKDIIGDPEGEHISSSSKYSAETEKAKNMINPGDVFQEGSYIDFENVEIMYDGDNFLVTNNREDIIRIVASVIGIKSDGTYELIEMPTFGGIDQTAYEKDMKENGWAVQKTTNMVRPGETLKTTMSIFDPRMFDKNNPAADVDGDGYYDVQFTISPQIDEETILTSADDLTTEPYKLVAD